LRRSDPALGDNLKECGEREREWRLMADGECGEREREWRLIANGANGGK
jgi:hypothetical protein